MIIYRLQHLHGKGIYTGGSGAGYACCKHGLLFADASHGRDSDDYPHPLPNRDGCRYYGQREVGSWVVYVSGFDSLEQMMDWFPKNGLEKLGACYPNILLHLYEVNENDVCFGNKQVTFNLNKAKLVDVVEPDHFNEMPLNNIYRLPIKPALRLVPS